MKMKSILLTLFTVIIMFGTTSFTSKKETKETRVFYGYDISFTGSDYNPPIKMIFDVYADTNGSSWWRATFKIRMYYLGGTGHWEGTAPLRWWVPEWGWNYRYYTAEAAPGMYDTKTEWEIGVGEALDGNDITVVSWEEE